MPVERVFIVARLTRFIAIVGLTGIVGLSLVTIFDILGRELFSVPIPGFSDVLDLSIVFSAAACFPASLAERHHVSVQFLGNIFPGRTGAALDLFGHTIALVVMVLIAWQVSTHGISVFENEEVTWLLGVKIWPVWLLVSLIFIVCIVVQALVVVQMFLEVLHGEIPAEEAEQGNTDAHDYKHVPARGGMGEDV